MKLPKWTIVAIGLLMVMVLGACGSKYGSPEASAETFYNAYEARDTDALKEAVCEQYQANVPNFEDEEKQLEASDNDGEDLIKDVKYEFEFDVRFNEEDDVDRDNYPELADADEIAVVNVYGTFRLRLITDVSDTEQKLHSRDDHPLRSLTLIKEDDDWKVCDPNAFSFAQ